MKRLFVVKSKGKSLHIGNKAKKPIAYFEDKQEAKVFRNIMNRRWADVQQIEDVKNIPSHKLPYRVSYGPDHFRADATKRTEK